MVIDISDKLHEKRKTKRQQLTQLQFNHELIMKKLTSKQRNAVPWCSGDYKLQALASLKVSKSKRVAQLVDIQVSLYDSMFGHSAEIIQLRKAA